VKAHLARQRFRERLAGSHCIRPGSVYDAISARIAEDLGFEIGMLGGSAASLAVLGAPDIMVLTLTELAEQVRRITRASAIPLLVDADHGFGNALNVRRTVEELEAAGAAALTIEDTELPKAFGSGGPRLIGIDEGIGKMEAALSARSDPELVIVGRTSAVLTSIEDAVARCRAYERAGVDALFLVGIAERAALEEVRAAVRLPLVLGGVHPDVDDPDYLARNGVRIALQGHLPIMAAMQATFDTLDALRKGAAPASLAGVSAELFKAVTRSGDYRAWTRRFLDTEM